MPLDTNYTKFREAAYKACDALRLSRLLQWAFEHDVKFAWAIDNNCTSADWSDDLPIYAMWYCVATIGSDHYALLGGIDFGYDARTEVTNQGRRYAEANEPFGHIYKLDVEAELVAEIKHEYEQAAIAGLGKI